ncbi:MAG TPA: tryptophan synthase subunit beta [Acidimicrobiia bacterium]|nr:tryptophan synthase subunit beta [Acidimicrobiia bacterium]
MTMEVTRRVSADGRYGDYGGRYVPETLMAALEKLEETMEALFVDPSFHEELAYEQTTFVGRPTPLTPARNLTESWGARVYLKREDLCHTGAHKINNAIGQALVARRLGVGRIVAETGAGQHGVAAAAAAARVGLPCTVYMGSVDVARQRTNVERMGLLGATVVPVEKGGRTLQAAIDEAMRDWVSDPDGTYYLLGSAVGPHPYPTLVAGLQSVIGRETRAQMIEMTGGLPDVVVACVGGGSNAIGMFRGFMDYDSVALLGVEAGGDGRSHSATLGSDTVGVLHGAMTPLLQDEYGQVHETHSIAPGLDYPGVGPEHAMLRDSGRARYITASDTEALDALRECSTAEGIIPALESAHALVGGRRWARDNPGSSIAICVSGRGDKDLDIISEAST